MNQLNYAKYILKYFQFPYFWAQIKKLHRKPEYMKTRILIWICLTGSIIIATGCSEKKEPVRIIDKSYKEVIKESRREAVFYMARSFMPGSSLAVSVKGKLVYSEGFGQASTDLEVPATRHTKYRIGGISQVLTSLAYYKMIEAGKLHPDSTVQKYYPEYPEKKYPFRIQTLIDNTSGIRTPTDEELNWRGLNISIKRGIETFKNDTLLFPPGAFHYPTIYSFNLLGAIMEEVTGEHFPKIIREWVTDTLKMGNTVPDNPLATIKNRTNFYDRDFIAQVVHATFRDLRHRLPSDGYLSTAEDIVKLGNALLYGTNISPTVREKMLTIPKVGEIELRSGNGLLFLENFAGNKFYASKGNVTGGGAVLVIFPQEELVLAWLANLDDSLDELPALTVANNFRDFIRGEFKTREQKMKEERKKAEEEAKKETEKE